MKENEGNPCVPKGERNTIYILGESRTNQENAITRVYGSFFLGLEIDRETGEIVDADCAATMDLTRSFIRRLFVGKNLKDEPERLEREIRTRYFGSSAKALVICFRDVRSHYLKITESGQS